MYVSDLFVGQYGGGVSVNKSLLTKEELWVYNEGYRMNGFNQFASDKIPLDRYLGNVTETAYVTSFLVQNKVTSLYLYIRKCIRTTPTQNTIVNHR